MIFVSAPYSNALNKVDRMHSIAKYSSGLLKDNKHVICPMTLGLSLTRYTELPYDPSWWVSWALDLLSRCDEIHVLCYDNWEESPGVRAEINFAKSKNIPITYINYK